VGSIHPHPALHTYIGLTTDDSTHGAPDRLKPQQPDNALISALPLAT
jgi:hypothetical protein